MSQGGAVMDEDAPGGGSDGGPWSAVVDEGPPEVLKWTSLPSVPVADGYPN